MKMDLFNARNYMTYTVQYSGMFVISSKTQNIIISFAFIYHNTMK